MTPASLRPNYIEELKKCGDHLYKKNQYWDFRVRVRVWIRASPCPAGWRRGGGQAGGQAGGSGGQGREGHGKEAGQGQGQTALLTKQRR